MIAAQRTRADTTAEGGEQPAAPAAAAPPAGRSWAPLALKVAPATDRLEHEADQTAQRVLSGASRETVVAHVEPRISRVANAPDNREAIAPPVVHDVLKSPGVPLDVSIRAFMEPRFGRGFGDVRLHTGADAAASARSVNASAYTVGPRIVFGDGQFAPHTTAGLGLLAHELTHVVQHGSDAPTKLHRFEAGVHEAGERYGLTTPLAGGALTSEEASAAYFGNWMRDMNQIFVPLITSMLPPDVVFALISYMAAKKFGRELTPEQFGYYIPAEHLDNPAGLISSSVAPVDLLPSQPAVSAAVRPTAPGRLGAQRPASLETRQEEVDPTRGAVAGVNIFAVDQSGVMAYVRRTNLHIERRLQLAANAGRTPDGLHHFGAALHAVEDLFAHSNYVEIAVDRLVRSDPTFLRQIPRAQRQVFTYAPRVQVGTAARTEQRPVLTTGSFTGTDTQISIASELVGILSRPLEEPPTLEQRLAQDRFIVSLLRTFESRLGSNPELQQAMAQAFEGAGVPGPLAQGMLRLPLGTIYEYTRVHLPDVEAVRAMRQRVRAIISTEVLQPLAGQLQAAALEARVSDTSLIQVLRNTQRQQRGEFTAAEIETMNQKQRFTGVPREQQEATARAEARARAEAIQATPVAVVAGPSHSQIAKDHKNSPFFGLAFLLKTVAVQRLRDKMVAVWGGPAFDFGWENFPPAPPSTASPEDAAAYEQSRRLYHVGRTERESNQESLAFGQAVIGLGGAPGQPYDLAAMRRQSAERIRAVSRALQAMASAPGASQTALDEFRTLLGRLSPQVEERMRAQLVAAGAAAGRAAESGTVADMNSVAARLMAVAAEVERARVHADRAQANAKLVEQRQAMLQAMAQQPNLDAGLAVALLYTLDEEIQATAVTYTAEQRAVVEGRQQVPELGASPRRLTRDTITLPAVTGSPAMVNLINEARLLVSHPYDNTWWERYVRDYARMFPARLINDIEARNEGVPFYRGAPGAGPGTGAHQE